MLIKQVVTKIIEKTQNNQSKKAQSKAYRKNTSPSKNNFLQKIKLILIGTKSKKRRVKKIIKIKKSNMLVF